MIRRIGAGRVEGVSACVPLPEVRAGGAPGWLPAECTRPGRSAGPSGCPTADLLIIKDGLSDHNCYITCVGPKC